MNHEEPQLPAATLDHLRAHHGDFEAFRDVMTATAPGRFGPLWWGVWDQYVSPELPGRPVVVDLGCGPGGLFVPLLAHRADVRIVGVEVQPAMLTTARQLAADLGDRAEVRIVEADLNGPLPLADASADAVTAVMVLHEMPFPVTLIAEAYRLLRPGGAMVIYDWCRQDLRDYIGDKQIDPGVIQHFREHCLYAAGDLAFLAERAGFVVLEVIGRRGGDYCMVALRKPGG